MKPPTAIVDFGETDGELIPWLFERVNLTPGTVVLMRDDDGNACYGEVRRIEGRIALLRPDWETWLAADSPLNVNLRNSVASRVSVILESPNNSDQFAISSTPSGRVSYA